MDPEKLATLLAQVFLIFGGVIPYVPQYSDISRSNDASGFSTFVPFLLIVSNGLRIVYWWGHPFDPALLLQSIIMIGAMFAMLELCVRVEKVRRAAAGLPPLQDKKFTDFKAEDFWGWTDLGSYIVATVLLLLPPALTMWIFKNSSPAVVEGVGYTALLLEACLAIPQLIKNFRSGSVAGLNLAMVVLWTLGDGFKEYFYIWKAQPAPFIACASIQLVVDLLILGQIALYTRVYPVDQ